MGGLMLGKTYRYNTWAAIDPNGVIVSQAATAWELRRGGCYIAKGLSIRRIQKIVRFEEIKPDPQTAFKELSAASKGRWNGVDANEYVQSIRDGKANACKGLPDVTKE